MKNFSRSIGRGIRLILQSLRSVVINLYHRADHFLRRSLQARVLLIYLLIVLIGPMIMVWTATTVAVRQMSEQAFENLMERGKRVNNLLQNPEVDWSVKLGLERAATILEEMGKDTGLYIQVFAADGTLLVSSDQDKETAGQKIDPNVLKKVLAGESVRGIHNEKANESYLAVAIPMGSSEAITGVIRLLVPKAGIDRSIQHIREALLWVYLLLLGSAPLATFLLTRTIRRPILTLARHARKLTKNEFVSKDSWPEEDEFHELVRAVRDLGEFAAKLKQEQKRFDDQRIRSLSELSHELRTPLTVILGMVEAIQDGVIADPEDQKKSLSTILQRGRNLNQLIDDILGLTHLETGTISIDPRPVEITEFLRHISDPLRHLVENSGNQFDMQLPDASLYVHADPDRLEQVITNLVKNACQFTQDGSIQVSTGMMQMQVFIRIDDTGCGIPPDQLERIWDRFYRTQALNPHTAGSGAGLGLTIVRKLVELHGGDIMVESKPGLGTSITVRLPAADSKPAELII